MKLVSFLLEKRELALIYRVHVIHQCHHQAALWLN